MSANARKKWAAVKRKEQKELLAAQAPPKKPRLLKLDEDGLAEVVLKPNEPQLARIAYKQEDGKGGYRASSGQHLRNVRYAEKEVVKIKQGLELFAQERDTTVEALDLCGKTKKKTWGRIMYLSGLKKRSVQSMTQFIRRMLGGKGGKWTQEEQERLADLVLAANMQPSWRALTSMFNRTEEHVRDKWKALFTTSSTKTGGKFNELETWSLRLAVCETTGELAPVHHIPWRKVRKFLPHRPSEACRKQWFDIVLPSLLRYQDKHGVPIEPDLIQRHLVRNLKKEQKAEEMEEVNWQDMNLWWPANMNRTAWRRLRRLAPDALQDGDFRETVAWVHEALKCKEHRRRDKRLLKQMRLAAEAEAAKGSDCEDPFPQEEEAGDAEEEQLLEQGEDPEGDVQSGFPHDEDDPFLQVLRLYGIDPASAQLLNGQRAPPAAVPADVGAAAKDVDRQVSVTRIPVGCKKRDLREYFGQFGDVVVVSFDREEQKARVEFVRVADARRCTADKWQSAFDARVKVKPYSLD